VTTTVTKTVTVNGKPKKVTVKKRNCDPDRKQDIKAEGHGDNDCKTRKGL
jgi:hypothetical protein